MRFVDGILRDGVMRPVRNLEDVASDERAAEREQIKRARLEVARRKSEWTEIPQTNLVRRGPHFLVDAESDQVYTLRNGSVFDPASASICYVTPETRLAFYVTEADEIAFMEAAGRTWTSIVERRAGAEQRRRAEDAEKKSRRRKLLKGST